MQNTLILNPSISFPHSLRLRINLKFFWILASILISSLLVFYIFQINNLVSESYLLQNYQKKTERLIQENEKLETSLVGIGSLGNIENLIKELNFEKISQIHYIQILESQVVTK